MKLNAGMALVRVRSHRGRDRLFRLLKREPQSYFSYHREGEWYEVRPAELDKIRAARIPGVTRAEWGGDLVRHWT